MQTINVSQKLPLEPEQAFALIADHERFLSGGALQCRITQPGNEEKNGLGARRVVNAKSIIFVEDIVAFQRPDHYEYKIVELGGSVGRFLALDHHGGRLQLQPHAEGTQVEWTSTFSVTTPLIGRLIERMIAPGISKAFSKLLSRAANQSA